MNDLTGRNQTRLFSIFEIVIIIGLASVPLFTTFPYRVNIFLTWEGAYRLSQGQIPYKDFGMPLGYMFWVIPAFFFKLFGTKMIVLVKAQVLINIISGLAFRSILKSLYVQEGIRLLSVFLYCLSFSFFNFWPWYNHTVIVYEMVALAFLFRYIMRAYQTRAGWIWLVLSALFTFCSFFTKQDGGGLTLILCLVLLTYHSINEKKLLALPVYLLSLLVIGFAFIYPLTKYNFGYWFNHGQPPHTTRIDAFDIIDEFFYNSQWIKFYLFIILLLISAGVKSWRDFFYNKKLCLFLLLTVGILAEAAILQVTSYTPPDNNIFFHSFAITFILSLLAPALQINLNRLKPLLICGLGILLWWSGTYWKYLQRIVQRTMPSAHTQVATTENIVNRRTYKIQQDSSDMPMTQWKYSKLKSFSKIYMPESTIDGINRIMNMDLVKNNKDLHVLNMSELTPLAVEMPYNLETGPDQPLWYHLGVAMFNREAQMFEQRIANKQYDLVLFEYIPELNNFYPFRVRDSLMIHYQKIDSFAAPRRGDTQGIIEVYTK